ncbi:putative flippase GtrA [Nocardioides thalensis]|uniref:Putative flippase GtrA n=1 Tax=Nocardioides thalensis TaxID=1914755 RepID=A0A853CA07_9ACTN|nr:putative flippase GtrA [Nocardioides thalensis]
MSDTARAAPSLDWRAAAAATVHCLVGCSIGEVLGMVLGEAWGLADAATIALSVGLAFVFGLLLAALRIRRHGLSWGSAARIAVASEFLSISTMEVVSNVLLVLVPGALTTGLDDPAFWLSLGIAMAVAFVVTLPVNAWLIARGRGHAAVGAHHGAPEAAHH